MKYYISALLVALSCICNRASADVIFTIDMDPGTVGIQSSRTVDQGQTFTVNVVMDVTGTTLLQSYGLSVRFDTVELNGNQAASLRPRPANWATLGALTVEDPIPDSNVSINAALGQFRNVAAGSTDPGDDVPAPFTGVVGTLSFTAANLQNSDGDIDILPGFFIGGVDALLGDNLGATTFIGGTLNINAVPEPSTMLLGSVALGMGYFARRKRDKRS